MSAPGAGILLALSGDDADILRALSQAGSGLCVVRRCADLPELLSAGMAGQGHTSQPHPAAGERPCTTQAPAPISGWTSVTVPPGSR